MSAVAETLEDLRRVLAARGLGWYVFGAQAVSVRGAPRTTQDIDVTVAVPRSGLPQLVGDLEAAGFHHRHPALADELVRMGAVLPLHHARTGMELDLVIAASGLEDLILRRAESAAIDGILVPVASATDLVVMKILAGRGKDLDDVRSLLAGGAVDLAEARDLLGQLEEALAQADLLPLLEAAVKDVGAGPPVR